MLEAEGYTVQEAVDGLDALAALARLGRIDAVVTDLQMPNMDGVALATYLAGQSPPIPTLMISGFGRQPGQVTGLGPLLPKPFSSEQLLESVQQVLALSPPRLRRA
jgi:two-component system chemotaxis response regulator CheY